MTSNITAMDVQSRVCADAIDKAEKYLGNICDKMASVNRKHAKIRDRGDELAHTSVEYAVKELPSIQAGLDAFGKNASDIQDYRQAYIDQIDSKVLNVLSDYGKKCKDARADLKRFEADRNKEKKKIDSINKAKTTSQLAQTQNDLVRLTESVKRSTKLLEESILKFEEKRLHDVKQAMMEYCRIEMTFAAKCLEQWSNCYQTLAKVSPQEDMIVFQQSLQPYKLTERLGVNTLANGQQSSLSSQLQNTSLTQPHLLSPSAQSLANHTVTSAAPVSQINRTAASSSVTQISRNGHISDEESGEEESEYETETEESEEEAQSPQRPAPIRTGWH